MPKATPAQLAALTPEAFALRIGHTVETVARALGTWRALLTGGRSAAEQGAALGEILRSITSPSNLAAAMLALGPVSHLGAFIAISGVGEVTLGKIALLLANVDPQRLEVSAGELAALSVSDFAARVGQHPEVVRTATDRYLLLAGDPRPRAEKLAILTDILAPLGVPGLAEAMLSLGPVTHLGAFIELREVDLPLLGSMAARLAEVDLERRLMTQDLRALRARVDALERALLAMTALERRLDAQEALRERLEALERAPRGAVISVPDLVTDAGDQIGEAARQLRLRSHGVRLGALTLTLRGGATRSAGPGPLAFGAAEDDRSETELTLRYAPSAPEEQEAPESPLVPRVIGVGEALARRKLEAAGYPVELRVQQAPAPGLRGRVLAQSPDRARAGALVTLTVGS